LRGLLLLRFGVDRRKTKTEDCKANSSQGFHRIFPFQNLMA
jgi:hypothetical protein